MDVGGATLAASLIRAGLIDEYRLFLQPVVLGAGRPFFPPLDERIGLTLLETRRFDSGVVYVRYGTGELSTRLGVSARRAGVIDSPRLGRRDGQSARRPSGGPCP